MGREEQRRSTMATISTMQPRSGISPIYPGCVRSSTLFSADDASRHRAGRANMQLKMPFLEADEPPSPAPSPDLASPPPSTWEGLDETARIAALGILARLIARMLAVAPDKENAGE